MYTFVGYVLVLGVLITVVLCTPTLLPVLVLCHIFMSLIDWRTVGLVLQAGLPSTWLFARTNTNTNELQIARTKYILSTRTKYILSIY